MNVKILFDTKNLYILIEILRNIPHINFVKVLIYLRLRMPHKVALLMDIEKNNLSSLRCMVYMGRFDKMLLDEATQRIINLTLKEKKRIIKEIITVNPLLSLELYRFFKIVNTQYYYLDYCLNNNLGTIDFFTKESFENNNVYLNEYNYHLIKKDYAKATKSMKNYFKAMLLTCPVKMQKESDYYIDSISMDETIKKYDSDTKVSIIITANNEELLIENAIKSLLLQSYGNIEIIFVDDASSDKTVDYLYRVCKVFKFENIKIIKMKKNVGTFVAKNIAISYATGDVIAFHDADDWSHPQKLELQLRQLIYKETVASISEMVRIRPDGTLFSKQIYPINQVCMISLMFKREVFEYLGFFYVDLIGADSEYYERILAYYGQKKLQRVEKVLTFAAHRSNSLMTSNTPEYGVYKKRILDWEECRNRQMKIFFDNKSPYISFNKSDYEYDIL